ncbi:hypothetical protein ERC79_19720 [Rhodococcus sp. ABRD24]|uniref:hypothetical protein n=1 Tax=Rhodococcus sp. ABRD24 TaxID=2507582 RepID=UPI00103C6F2A|nr:hypothetical protein [Rhodococcus sp. ABRD24]QBJ97924.1 hypothetical protein ERC79_19720 [Rhodococcus sp. ABRD24]
MSRLTGTDPAVPPLFVNPGGPGVEGRSMAATVALSLGLDTADFHGASWGTVLGAELQSRFPKHLCRVVLHSMD